MDDPGRGSPTRPPWAIFFRAFGPLTSKSESKGEMNQSLKKPDRENGRQPVTHITGLTRTVNISQVGRTMFTKPLFCLPGFLSTKKPSRKAKEGFGTWFVQPV